MSNKCYIFALLIFMSIVTFFSAACETAPAVKKGPLPGEAIANLPKMEVGDSWVSFGGRRSYGTETTIFSKVTEVSPDGSFIIEAKTDKGQIYHRNFDNEYRMVSLISIGKQEPIDIPKPPEKILAFPLFVGKKWKGSFRFVGLDNYLLRSTAGEKDYLAEYAVDKFETIDTKAGSFRAFKIVKKVQIIRPSWSGTHEYWYSPETKNLVKYVIDSKLEYELISYQLAGARPLEIQKPKIIAPRDRIKIAIVDFQGLNEGARIENLGKILTEGLTTSIAKSEAFKIIERTQLEKVLLEIQLTQSGIIDTSNAKQIGKMVGADAIVIGSVSKIGDDMRLDARIIDVESGIILSAATSEGPFSIKSINLMTDSIVKDLIGKFYPDKK